MSSQLPPGWAWATFGEVAQVAANLVDPAEHPDMPHIAPNHIESRTGRLLPYATVAEDGVTSPKHRFEAGALLYSKIRPYLAKATISPVHGLCSADMYPIRTWISSRYLLYWLLSDEFTALAAGQQGRSLLPKINQVQLEKLPVPVAPAGEQQRIADALDERLPVLESIRASAGLLKRRVGQLHEIVLRAELPPECEESRLGDLLASPLSNGRSVPTRAGGFPVLRLTAIHSGTVDTREAKPGDWTAEDATPWHVHAGDFLVARGNGSLDLVGRGALVEAEPEPVAFPDTLIRVRVDETVCRSRYLRLIWHTRRVRRQIESRARTTAGIYKVNQGHLEAVRFPLPSVDEQDRIVERMERYERLAGDVQAQLDAIEAQLSVVRRALLHTAFTGQLVPQDPADEPADLLLKRIAEERTAASSDGTRRRRTVNRSGPGPGRPNSVEETA